jgi:signal transduction histidine kinase/DNA-binding response OmpR family regulator
MIRAAAGGSLFLGFGTQGYEMTAKRSTTSIALMITIAVAFAVSVSQIVLLEHDTVHARTIEQQLRQIEMSGDPAAPPRDGQDAVTRDLDKTAHLHDAADLIAAALLEHRRHGGWLMLLATLAAMSLVTALGAALAGQQTHRNMTRKVAAAGEALARSEGTRTRFLEVIAHDLRQPIQTIELFSAGLKRRHLDPESAPMLDGIQSSLASMRRMLSGLMDVSRLDAGAVAPELHDVAVADIFTPIAAEFMPLAAARGLRFDVIDGGAAAHTDPVILECVLRNLVSNAVRYTRVGSVTMSCSAAAGRLSIMVSDTGPGIAEAELGRIFQEFYRVSSTAQSTEGLGLGLAIVRRMITLLDIALEVSSTVGQGTTFTVVVPSARGAVAALPAPPPHPHAHGGPGDDGTALALVGAQVFVIDDDEQVRRGLTRELSARGMAVTAIAGPDAALALFTAEPRPRFDIALVDRDLGAELTGPELLDYLAAKLHVAMPALLLSGTQDFKVIAELQEAGYPWLSKPVNIDVLLREMARLIAPRDGSFPDASVPNPSVPNASVPNASIIELETTRPNHRLHAIARAERAIDAGEVNLDRAQAEIEAPGDVLGRTALGEKFENIDLPRR